MVADMKEKYGQFIPTGWLGDIRKKTGKAYPFSQSLKKFTADRNKEIFSATQDKVAGAWKKNRKKRKNRQQKLRKLTKKTAAHKLFL